MARLNQYYQLEVMEGDGVTSHFIIDSVPGSTNPFTLEPPSGDGPSLDPLKGSMVTGSYTYRVLDNGTTFNAVTPELADADARQQLLSRKAFVRKSPDGSAWTSLGFGYINAVRMPAENQYEFAIGDTQRKEVSTDIFKYATPAFPKTTAIIGGPIIGGFGSFKDFGGWGYRVADVNGFGYVQMDVVSGKIFDPRKANQGSEFRNLSTVSTALADYTNAVARPFFEDSEKWKGATIHGHFPGLEARVQTTEKVIVGYFTPLARRTNVTVGYWFGKGVSVDKLIRNGTPSLYLDQNGFDSDGVTPLTWNPGIDEEYEIYIYIKEISKDNPLHYAGHPVDLWQAIRDEAGIDYDASVLPAVKAAVGTDVRLQLRITEASKIGAFDERVIYGPFGLSTRMVNNGERQLFSSRQKSAAVPTDTLSLTDLREPGRPFELDESTAIKRVILKQLRIVPWTTEDKDQPEPDGLIAFDSTISIDNSDADATVTGVGEVAFDIPGQITIGPTGFKTGTPTRMWLAGVADEIFDRWGRGIIGGEFQCGHSITALIGEELLADLPHMPVANAAQSPVTQRGGERIIQIVGRTETPSGPNIKWLDAGSADAPGVVPTFTVAANATDGRKYVDVVITNGPAIAAIDGRIRVWVATGASPASGSGSLAVLIDPAVDALSFTLPGFDAGTHVHVQMQTVVTDQRPGALSAFQSVNLTDLAAVTGLAVSAQDAGDPSRRTLTWAVGETDIPVEVALRLTAETTAANRVVAVLPPGSTQYELTGLDAANRTASVRHIESPPYAGASTYATVAVNTSGTARTLNPPTDPRAFSYADGTFGMDVEATEFPSEVEFQVQTGVGAFETAAIVTSVGGRTVYTDFGTNDGVTRNMRARHIATGLTASNWTATVSAVPWTDDPVEDCQLVPVTSGGEIVFDSNGEVVLACYSG